MQDVGVEIFGQVDKWATLEVTGDLNHILKAGYVGDTFFDPDQKQGPSNTNHRGGGSYLKILFLEFHQVLGKDPDLSDVHSERCGPLFLVGIEFKLIQVEVGLLPHGQDTAVLEFNAQRGFRACLDVISEMNGHSGGDLDRRRNTLAVDRSSPCHPGNLSDRVGGMGGQRKGQEQQGQHQQPVHQSDRKKCAHFCFHHGILIKEFSHKNTPVKQHKRMVSRGRQREKDLTATCM